jgi:hypothetical protein
MMTVKEKAILERLLMLAYTVGKNDATLIAMGRKPSHESPEAFARQAADPKVYG